jgi:uridylate kinase
MSQEIVVISLGGSLIIPKTGFDVKFLRAFRGAILALDKKYQIILVCGGGATARAYQAAAKALGLHDRELDYIGIGATRYNAHFIKTLFGRATHATIVKDPRKKVIFKEKILLAAGWEPGWSTDYDAVVLAKVYGAKRVINLTDIDYLHDKNPKNYPDAVRIKETDWAGFRKIVGEKFTPGANTPFDPVASRAAQKAGLTLVLANGKKIANLIKIIKGDKKFTGSIVH